ncbi:unnamed protein product, partial [Scytosiphon promiscuus]
MGHDAAARCRLPLGGRPDVGKHREDAGGPRGPRDINRAAPAVGTARQNVHRCSRPQGDQARALP